MFDDAVRFYPFFDFPSVPHKEYVVYLCRVGISLPNVEVRFNDLSVNADIHVGSRALPTLLNFCRNIFGVSILLYVKSVYINKILFF